MTASSLSKHCERCSCAAVIFNEDGSNFNLYPKPDGKHLWFDTYKTRGNEVAKLMNDDHN